MKTKIMRFRVAAWRRFSGGGYFTITADSQEEESSYEEDEDFVCWLTDWQEAEVKAGE